MVRPQLTIYLVTISLFITLIGDAEGSQNSLIVCRNLLFRMRKAAQYQNDSQIYTYLMKYDESHRPSPQQPEGQKISRLRLILSTICPCFIGNSSNDQYSNHEETKSNLNAQKQIKGNSIVDVRKEQQITVQTLVNEAARKKAKESLTSYEVGINNENIDSNTAISSQKWSIYPISQIKEDKLIVTGSSKKYLLCKIKRVEVEAGRSQRSYIKKPSGPAKITSNTSKNVDKYWHQRYSLFSKFDEGVSINENSWAVMIPEAVSEYIGGKIKYETVANLYAGVGGDAIKLANTCGKVIVWDQSEINMKSLYINSKIYGSENIEITQNLSAVFKKELQFIVISSLMKIQQSLSSPISDVPAQISNILTKFLPICSNFALILPANINITTLTEIIANQIKNLNIKTETCCLKIQKIFYAQQLKYLAVFFGTNIENSIAIHDQLNWIYKKLHLDTGKSNDEKKLIKKLREMYGMVQLLNFVLQSSQFSKGSPVQKFIQYVKKHSLLPDQKMVKYIKDSEIKKQMKEVDYDQQESGNFDEPEKTVSSISIPSIIQRVSIDNNQVENENDPYRSAAFNNRETLKSIQTKSLIKEGSIDKKQSIEKHGKIVKRKSEDGGRGEEDRSSMVELYPIELS